MADWYGTVNVGNIEEVAERLKTLLAGKLFTTVHLLARLLNAALMALVAVAVARHARRRNGGVWWLGM